MPREIRKHTHCFDLNLFVLSSKQEVFDAVEHGTTEFCLEKWHLRSVIIENVCNTANGIKYKLFVFFYRSSIHCVAELVDELIQELLHLVKFLIRDGLFD